MSACGHGSTQLKPNQPSPRWESANLDFLRAIAVLLVFVFHLLITFNVKPWMEMGRFGVLIFFVHTSLVLMLSLERLESRGESIFRSFYLRRVFRIYPLSIFWVSLIVIWHVARAPWWPWQNPTAWEIICNLLLCMNLFYVEPVTSVLWSLPYEVEMYLVLPLLYLFGKRKGFRGMCMLWVISVGVALVQPHISGRLSLAGFGPCFVAGVLAYFLGFKRLSPRFPFLLWPATIAGAAGVLIGLERLGVGLQEASWPACLLIGVAVPYFRELRWKPLRTASALIARYSYGIYLTHLTVMWFSFVILRSYPAFIQWTVFVTLSVAVPVALYHWLEAPMIKAGAYIVSRLKKSPETSDLVIAAG
ncbi:MAG TPA: acyltransferase [Bryobacteraceae bacterium]|nr:acyltransferase [Bryobacteraceae bacterium]